MKTVPHLCDIRDNGYNCYNKYDFWCEYRENNNDDGDDTTVESVANSSVVGWKRRCAHSQVPCTCSHKNNNHWRSCLHGKKSHPRMNLMARHTRCVYKHCVLFFLEEG